MLTLLLTLAVTKPVHPVMRPLVLKVPGTQTVRVLRDLAYEQTPGGPQLADVYLPPKKSARRPVAIFIHGGVPPDVPRPKSWGVYESWGRTIAASGFVGVVFNHRLQYPDPHLLEAQADLDAILAYVKAHASEWNGRCESGRPVRLLRRRTASLTSASRSSGEHPLHRNHRHVRRASDRSQCAAHIRDSSRRALTDSRTARTTPARARFSRRPSILRGGTRTSSYPLTVETLGEREW